MFNYLKTYIDYYEVSKNTTYPQTKMPLSGFNDYAKKKELADKTWDILDGLFRGVLRHDPDHTDARPAGKNQGGSRFSKLYHDGGYFLDGRFVGWKRTFYPLQETFKPGELV